MFPGYESPLGDPFDPAKARTLMVEAGYRNASGAYDPSTFPVDEMEITYNTSESNRAVAEFVQAQWKQNLGITVPLRNMEFRTFLVTRSQLDYRGVARSGWIGDYMDPFTFLSMYVTAGGDNGSGWTDPEFVRLLNEANRQADPDRRYRMLAQAEDTRPNTIIAVQDSKSRITSLQVAGPSGLADCYAPPIAAGSRQRTSYCLLRTAADTRSCRTADTRYRLRSLWCRTAGACSPRNL